MLELCKWKQEIKVFQGNIVAETNVACARKQGNICVRNNVSATMFLVCGGLNAPKEVLILKRTWGTQLSAAVSIRFLNQSLPSSPLKTRENNPKKVVKKIRGVFGREKITRKEHRNFFDPEKFLGLLRNARLVLLRLEPVGRGGGRWV